MKSNTGHIQNSDREYKSVHLKLPMDMDSDRGRTSINKIIIYSCVVDSLLSCSNLSFAIIQGGVNRSYTCFSFTPHCGYKSTLTQMVEEESCVY